VEITFEPITTNSTRYIFGSAWSEASDFQEGLYVQNGKLQFVCGDVWGSSFGLGTGIKATGDQYIDTGYLSKRSSRIETSFLLSQRTGTQYIFGGINKTDNTWAVADNLGLYFQLTSGKFAVPIRYWNGSTTS
jgi:hypothetical protein